MYEDLNEIATLRFNKELESISNQTRERVREMQNRYAAITSSPGVRSGPQEAAIGRTQIEGSEQLMGALFEIWVDLVKRRNGHISRSDVDFIAKKLEGFAQTQKGHLHKAFSTQRMGAVVNLLSQEADRQLHAATANARRDLAIMVREHELFSSSPGADEPKGKRGDALSEDRQQLPTATPQSTVDQARGPEPKGHSTLGALAPPIKNSIWAQMWSWGVAGSIVLFALAGGIAFMTSGHRWAADGFYVAGTALFLAKFWTWEETRQQPPARKRLLQAGVTLLSLTLAVLALLWNHAINHAASPSGMGPPAAMETESTERGTAHDSGSDAPTESKPEEQTGKIASAASEGRTISVAERVKVITAGHLLAKPADDLKPGDDFEADLGADPYEVSLLMDSLGLEFGITIPPSDSRNLHTVGETISYIEKKVQHKQEQERKQKEEEKQNAATARQTTNPSPQTTPPAEGAAASSGRVVTIADRVRVIIARRLDLPAPQHLKPEDDFEMDLGATPTQVSLILYDLGEEYKMKIPDSDAKTIKTVGEAIAYVEKEEK